MTTVHLHHEVSTSLCEPPANLDLITFDFIAILHYSKSQSQSLLHRTRIAKMAGKDPHPQGGNLSDMAVDGTTVPADSAKPRTIPSVPRPDQISDSNNYGATDLAGAADNANDISRVSLSHWNPLNSPRDLTSNPSSSFD